MSKLMELMNEHRRQKSEETLQDLSAMRWLEQWLKEYDLLSVMQENATGFAVMTHGDRENTGLVDWSGRHEYREVYTPAHSLWLYIPDEYKPLVIKSLMQATTNHGLEWKKDYSLSYTKPYGGKIPFAFETWNVHTHIEGALSWQQNQIHINFYRIPEIGDAIGGNCFVEEVEESTAARSNVEVRQVCRKEEDSDRRDSRNG